MGHEVLIEVMEYLDKFLVYYLLHCKNDNNFDLKIVVEKEVSPLPHPISKVTGMACRGVCWVGLKRVE